MKQLIIAILFLLPISVSAQLLRSYGVVEIGATFPTSTLTGAKFAYRTVDSSFYRWTSGNTWVKIVEPSIIPDTLYLTESIGTSYKVSGDTINLTPYLIASDTTAMLVKYIERGDTAGMMSAYIRSAGWGLLKTTNTLTVDSSKVASRYYVSTSPTAIANNYIATSNGTNLVARNLFDDNTAVEIKNGKPLKLGQWTTAGRPTGVTGYDGFNTSFGEHEYYSISEWYFRSPWKQSTSSTNVFLNSGSAILNSSSVLNSNYKLQVNGGALYSGATFTTNQTNQAALDIRGVNITAASGTTDAIWGINIQGAMTFNTTNQTYGGLRIATTSNATTSQYVKPIEVLVSSATLAEGSIVNTNATNGVDWVVGGGGTIPSEKVTIRSPNGGSSSGALPGLTYLSSSGAFSWALTGRNNGFAILSNPSSVVVNAVDPTLVVRGKRVLMGSRPATTPTATLEITGEGTGNSTTTFLVQNSSRANNAFRIRDDASARFGGKMMVGADTSFVHNPTTDTTYIQGNTRVKAGDLTIQKVSGTPYLNILASATSGNQEAGIYFRSRGSYSPIIEFDAIAGAAPSALQLPFYNYNTTRGGQQVFVIGSEPGQFGAKSIGRFSVWDTLSTTRRFSFFSNGLAVFDAYATPATTAAALSKTFARVAAFATDGTVLSATENQIPNFYNNNDTIGTSRIATVLDSVRFNNGATQILKLKSNGQVTLGKYTSSGDYVPSIVGEAPTDLFLITSASTGKVMQRKMRQVTNVTDADLTITSTNLRDAQDIHVWAYCTFTALDSVVVDLPTPSSTYQGQIVSVYGDGRNAVPNRDVYVRAVGAKLWHGNSAPTAESYFQVTSLSGGINSRTAAFICAYNGTTYYWQLMKSHD